MKPGTWNLPGTETYSTPNPGHRKKRAGQMNWLKSKANLILKARQRQYRQFMPIHNYLNHLNLTPKEMVFEYVWIYLNTRVNLWCLQKLRDADFRGAKDHVPVYSWSLHSYRHEHLSRPVHWHSPGRTLAHGHKRLQQDLPAHTLSYIKIIIIHFGSIVLGLFEILALSWNSMCPSVRGFHGPKRTFIVFETSVICGGLWHMAWRQVNRV